MRVRPILFWSHLVAGVITGLVVLVLSLTGAILAFEPQILDRVRNAAVADSVGTPLDLDGLVAAAREAGVAKGATITPGGPGEAVEIALGRKVAMVLDPVTGAEVADSGASTQAFFDWVQGLHTSLTPIFDREAGGVVADAANLVFLFLILTGLYLWLPKIWRWGMFRMRLLFRRSYPDGKARDFAWHHVFGIWAAVPLTALALSGVVMSYPWANAALYGLYGETAPAPRVEHDEGAVDATAEHQPGQGGGFRTGGVDAAAAETAAGPLAAGAVALPFAELARTAEAAVPAAETVALILPGENAGAAVFRIDTAAGQEWPGDQVTVSVDRATGEAKVIAQTLSPAGATRGFLRFLHTGEVFGWAGQLVAAVASLAAVLLVWTGFAQSWRRLVAPMFRRRRLA